MMKSQIADAGSLEASAPLTKESPATFAATRALSNFHLFFLAALVFILPNAIFAAALRPAVAAVILAGCAGAAAILWRPRQRSALLSAPIDFALLAISLSLGVALCMLGGEGHIFYATTDWLIRDAVLSDLVRNGLTVLYRYEGQDYLLRAPLGMYMIPAVVGRLWGLYAAHMALLAQNALILGTIAYFTAQVANVRKTPFLLLLIAFSGLDIVPILFAEAVEMSNGRPFMPFTHIEWWGEYYSTIRLQYSAHITQLFWVPNHMAPGWWFGLLSLLYVRREVDLSTVMVSFAALLMWSPLAMMGAAPFVALFALEMLPKRIFAPGIFAAAAIGLCFLPIALYLTTDAGAVPNELLLLREGYWLRFVLFLAVEIPQAAIVLYAWNKVQPEDRRILALSLALLLVIPFYSVGVSNDFVMRVSIPPLFLLAYAFARIAVLTPRDDSAFPTAISVIVILSVATPLLEIKQALRQTFAISDCNMLTGWHKGDPSVLPTNYWARVEKIPGWLMSTQGANALTLEDRKCWPDHPFLQDHMK
ncbi:MAG: hypothetical protein CTY15_00890 [Methylocystis sp.]|nr:MAG: hypothetical protein CTY15_00890 [Methylocystis sp.]